MRLLGPGGPGAVARRRQVQGFRRALRRSELRQGIKEFSNWPTIPQLYVKGEFVGGCDIIREMYQSGELATFLQEKGVETEVAA